MTPREFSLAIVALVSLLCMTGVYAVHVQRSTDTQRQQADTAYNSVRRNVEARHYQLQNEGLRAGQQRSAEDIIARVRSSLQDAGIPAVAMRAVRPRQEQVINEGAAVKQMVQIELQGLSPVDIGTWLNGWKNSTNPWRIDSMNWRHNQKRGGNVYDVHVTCTAVLMQ